MRRDSRNAFMDTLRLAASFFVVVLHVPLPGAIGELLKPILRCAVPFFFMVSGYWLFGGETPALLARLEKRARRAALLLAAGCAAFFAMHIGYSVLIARTGFAPALRSVWNLRAALSFFAFNNTDFFWPGGAAHLWFLAGLLYALLLLRLLLAAVPLRRLYPLIPVLLAAAVPVAFLAARRVADVQERDMLTRNFLFTGLPCVLAGMWLRQNEQALHRLPAGVAVSLPLYCAALCVIERFTSLHNPFGLARILLAGSLVLLSARFPAFGAGTFLPRFGARYSLMIYIIHYPIATAFKWLAGRAPPALARSGALLVFAASLGIAAAWDICKQKINERHEHSEEEYEEEKTGKEKTF